MSRKQQGIKAWLVTWDGCGPHAEVHGAARIAAILNPRLSADRVKSIVELIYVNSSFSLSERIDYAKRGYTPYPVQFGTLNKVTWLGQMTCGHNPYLYARLVNGIRRDTGAPEGITWDERPPPNMSWLCAPP
jgi:hypothetical protein